MNRLILIGNGFDLAHGLRTSYNDFILWYLIECFTRATDEGHYDDPLIQIKTNYKWGVEAAQKGSIAELVTYFFQKNINILVNNSEIDLENKGVSHTNPFSVKVTPGLLQSLLSKCKDLNWVDIENEYYLTLKEILTSRANKREGITALNSAMESIISSLQQYLSSLPQPAFNSKYLNILHSDIDLQELHVGTLRPYFGSSSMLDKRQPDKTLILNFNYTATFELYSKDHPRISNLNYIHGKIDQTKNPIIFGFGDELDKDYLTIEMEKTKGFFEYLKSFWYFKTSNYHRLITFIDSDEYQVFIMGHSCGLSDRTMLNMIFEHENCKSIKIFYHEFQPGKNNFTELTQEISRHFKDKGMFRKKVVNFEYSQLMPQVKD